MKPTIITTALLLALGSGQAMAQLPCPTPVLTGAQLISTLSGKYVCAARTTNSDTWNELHQGAGAGPSPILDYKRGPADPVDPSKVVGTYLINVGANTVTYDYGDPGGPYTYTLTRIPQMNPELPSFGFCNVSTGERIPAIISSSQTHALCGNIP